MRFLSLITRTLKRIPSADTYYPTVTQLVRTAPRYRSDFHLRFKERILLTWSFCYQKYILRKLVLSWAWSKVLYELRTNGFVFFVFLDPVLKHEPAQYYFLIKSKFLPRLTDAFPPRLDKYSRGFSADPAIALSKCIGECLERTPAIYYRHDRLLNGSFVHLTQLQQPVVHPRQFAVFSPAQQLRVDHGVVYDLEQATFGWELVEALTINHGHLQKAYRYVPAQLIYWGYNRAGEPLLRENSSHGGAGYFTWSGAVLRALYECIGRDGFFTHWHQHAEPTVIDIAEAELSAAFQSLYQTVSESGFRVTFVSVESTVVSVPSVACVLEHPESGIAQAVVGHGCDLDPAAALQSALEEALSIYHWHSYGYSDTHEHKSVDTYSDVERLSYYAAGRGKEPLARFLHAPQQGYHAWAAAYQQDKTTLHTDEQKMQQLISACSAASLEVFIHTFTHSTLKKLGYNSVKVIIPGLVPMYHHQFLLPTTAGHSADLEPQDYPHPFP